MIFAHHLMLAIPIAAAVLFSILVGGATPAVAAEGCGERLKITVHYLPTQYIYSKSLKSLARMVGQEVWGFYTSSSRFSGKWTRRGECVKVRIAVNVHSKIYLAKELKKRRDPRRYKCTFARILKHEKRHRTDDRRSLRNLLKKRNALINKLNKGTIRDFDTFINYTIGQLEKMLRQYYSEAGKRSDYFHRTVESNC